MERLWYAIVSVMLAVYVVLDGFDLGAGALHRILARNERERRTLLAATGPLWDGNEVWLLAGGGALFCAFPAAYAAGFSGFYLPLMLVLWLLIGRGLAMELRNHHGDPLWRSFWDTILVVSCTLLSVVLGAAIGNVIRGVPIDESGTFHLPLFSRAGDAVLDRYTVSTGVLALLVLAHHGARFVAWKVDGELHQRTRTVARALLYAMVPVLLLVTIGTVLERPELLGAMIARPLAWLLAAAVCASLGSLCWLDRKEQDLLTFLASGKLIVALLAATAAGSYPLLLRSTIAPRYDLDAYNAAASAHGLRAALTWWCIGMPLAAGYFAFLFRSLRGKVRA
jgi:cytochrome d ubiquinol oxidase subunit II